MSKIPQGNITDSIVGAPYEIGELVRIVFAADETCNMRYMRCTGVIVHYNYSCGCGQSFPNDPMIGVEFSDGVVEEFWHEEIVYLRDLLLAYDDPFHD